MTNCVSSTELTREITRVITVLPQPGSLGTRNRFERDQRTKQMKPSTKDQIKGTLHEVKGKVKEKAGQVTNNPDLEAEGQAENLGGKIQKKVGQIKKVFGE